MSFFGYNDDFVLFGQQHIFMIVLTIALSILLPFGARRWLPPEGQVRLSRGMALVLAFWVIFWIGVRLSLGDFDRRTDVPLDICNMMALLSPALMWRPQRRIHEVLYFWVLAGTLQAVLTPHLFDAFPTFTFFKYWFVHGGLIVYTIYNTIVFRLFPRKEGIWRAFGYLQIYVGIVFVLNSLLDANYVYIMGKPPTASPLDFLGPWPWYILVAEGLGLALFGLAYAPVAIFRRNQRNR